MIDSLEHYEPEPNSGCWLWKGSVRGKGYAQLPVPFNGSRIASRYFYTKHKGVFPSHLFVLHKCDNPSCVNPDHLFIGTAKDNMVDKKNKDRAGKGVPKQYDNFWKGKNLTETAKIKISLTKIINEDSVGEKNSQAKLTLEKVRLIRLQRTHGKSMISLSNEFDISVSQIKRILRNDSWVDSNYQRHQPSVDENQRTED